MGEHAVCKRGVYELHYWRDGEGSGPVAIFLHGATLDHRMFRAQVTALTRSGYVVLSTDLRGHGRSRPMGRSLTVTELSDDVAAILDDATVPSAIIVGHSLGGYVAQEFVRHFPHRTKALAVIGCTDLARKISPLTRFAFKMMPTLLSLYRLEDLRRATLEHLSKSESVRAYAREAMAPLTRDDFVTLILATLEGMGRAESFPSKYVIPVPFFLTHGSEDNANRGMFRKSAPAWAERQPHCRYEIVPDAGHIANMDNPDAFNAMLKNFLAANGL